MLYAHLNIERLERIANDISVACQKGYRKTTLALLVQALYDVEPQKQIDPEHHYDELGSLLGVITNFYKGSFIVIKKLGSPDVLLLEPIVPKFPSVLAKCENCSQSLFASIRFTLLYNLAKMKIIKLNAASESELEKLVKGAMGAQPPVNMCSTDVLKDSVIALRDIILTLKHREELRIDTAFFFNEIEKKFGNEIILKVLRGQFSDRLVIKLLQYILKKDMEIKRMLVRMMPNTNQKALREVFPLKVAMLLIAGTLPKYASGRGFAGYELNSVHSAVLLLLSRYAGIDDELINELMKNGDNKLKYLLYLKQKYLRAAEEFKEYMDSNDYERIQAMFTGFDELQIRLGEHRATIKYEGNDLVVNYIDHDRVRAEKFLKALKRWGIADSIDIDNSKAVLRFYNEKTIERLAKAMALTTSIDIQGCVDILDAETLERAAELRAKCVNEDE